MIGALPPPFIGPSIANVRLSQSPILNEAFDLHFFDISDRRDPANIGHFDFGNATLGVRHLCTYLLKLARIRPQVIYLGVSQGFWGYVRDLGFIIPALCFRRKVVIHLRGSEFHVFYKSQDPLTRWVTRWVFRNASSVMVLGDNLRFIFKDLVPAERIAVVPNGINTSDFDRAADPKKTRGKRILFVSSLRKRKGLLLLLEAAPAILAAHPDATFTVAGAWHNETDRQESQRLIQKHGLQDKCVFIGEISGEKKIRTFLDHDLFVFPPVQPEGLPWVILEAMSAGLPIVTTDQGAIAEVVVNGETGFITQPTVQTVAERVNYLLSNPSVADRMGTAGRARVDKFFSERACHEALKSVFESVIQTKPAVSVSPQGQSENVVALR